MSTKNYKRLSLEERVIIQTLLEEKKSKSFIALKLKRSAKAIVIKTQHRHIGHGLYKLEVFYQFKVGTDTVITQATSKGFENVTSSKYIEGDSILVGYNPKNHTESFISKKIYGKPRN